VSEEGIVLGKLKFYSWISSYLATYCLNTYFMPLTWQTLATVINSSSKALFAHNFISRQNDNNTPVHPFSWRLHQAAKP